MAERCPYRKVHLVAIGTFRREIKFADRVASSGTLPKSGVVSGDAQLQQTRRECAGRPRGSFPYSCAASSGPVHIESLLEHQIDTPTSAGR